MKVEKTVTEQGYIKVTISDLPKFPDGTRISYANGYGRADGELEILPSIDYIERGNYKFANTGSYTRFDTAERIAKVLDRRFAGFFEGYAEFQAQHTETAEIKTVAEISADLQAQGRLYYRDKKGQIRQLP